MNRPGVPAEAAEKRAGFGNSIRLAAGLGRARCRTIKIRQDEQEGQDSQENYILSFL
jgi:hypothetical protein